MKDKELEEQRDLYAKKEAYLKARDEYESARFNLIAQERRKEAQRIYELFPKPWEYDKMTKAELLNEIENHFGSLELDAYGHELKEDKDGNKGE